MCCRRKVETMGFCRLASSMPVLHSQELKERAVLFWEDTQPCEVVCEVLNVSRTSLYRWKPNWILYGSVLGPDRRLRGRSRALTADDRDDIRDLLHLHPDYYIDEVLQWLELQNNRFVSRTTIRQCIIDAGFSYKLLRACACLRNEVEINLFKNLIWNTIRAIHIVAVDESSKDGHTLFRSRGWQQKAQTETVKTDFDRGERWSLLPAMSTQGYEAKRVIKGSVDTLEFNDFILNEVVSVEFSA